MLDLKQNICRMLMCSTALASHPYTYEDTDHDRRLPETAIAGTEPRGNDAGPGGISCEEFKRGGAISTVSNLA